MGDPADILRRIERTLGAEALSALRRLPPRDLHSLLLRLMAERADRLGPQDLLAHYERTPAFAPSFADPRTSVSVQDAAFTAAAAFTAVELSTVCPLGTMRVMGGIHQNNVLSATRGAEVLGDPTPVLALECARRRRRPAERTGTLRLCTTQRLMRMQPVPIPGLLPHFRLFALVTAGQRAPGFEVSALREHIQVYLRMFRVLADRGFFFSDIRVDISDVEAMEGRLAHAGISVAEVRRSVRTHHFADPDALLAERGLAPLRGTADEVLPALAGLPAPVAERLGALQRDAIDPLRAAFPEVHLRLDLSRLEGLGYYTGPCLRIGARNAAGDAFTLVDGGFTTWTQRLLSDARERFLPTGIGSDLICARFRA